MYTFYFRYNATAHLVAFRILYTQLPTHWEPPDGRDSCYCHSCFTVVIWTWTHNIFEVCLYNRNTSKKKFFEFWNVGVRCTYIWSKTTTRCLCNTAFSPGTHTPLQGRRKTKKALKATFEVYVEARGKAFFALFRELGEGNWSAAGKRGVLRVISLEPWAPI